MFTFLCPGDQSKRSHLFCISVNDFERDVLPNLCCNDTVICIYTNVEGVVSKEDHTHLETVMEKYVTKLTVRIAVTL